MKVLSNDVGTRNMGICLLAQQQQQQQQPNPYPFELVHWELLNLNSHLSANMATQRAVEEFLARRNQGIYDVDAVIIESQEKSIETMKCLASGIQAHFETAAALLDKPYRVHWSSGNVKLRLYQGPATWKPSKSKDRRIRNKHEGIQHCRAILQAMDEPGWLRWFKRLAKKDDVADAFLQAGYFLLHRAAPEPEVHSRPRNSSQRCQIESSDDDDDSDDDGSTEGC